MNSFIVWMIPLLPLIAFLLLISFGRRWKESVSVFTGSLAAFLSLVLSVWVLADQWGGGSERLAVFPWLTLGETTISMGMEITRLNALMLLVVSLVSFLVQVYSAGYMRGDSRFGVFYAYLSLFTFSMLGLVIAPNLLQLYIFWELVGVVFLPPDRLLVLETGGEGGCQEGLYCHPGRGYRPFHRHRPDLLAGGQLRFPGDLCRPGGGARWLRKW